MMPPPRQQAEHMAQIGLVGGLFQNTASDRDGGVAGEHDLVTRARDRSEEHTSELQSLMRISYAVFCLQKTTVQHTLRICLSRTQTTTSISPPHFIRHYPQ